MPTELFEASKISPDTLTGAVWRVKVISGDVRGSSAYYPKEVVEAGAPLFAKGLRIYGDHPTSDEKWSRPERSYKDIIGVFESDAEFDGTDLYANARFFTKHQQDIKEMAEAGVIGMSIRAAGDVEETADGPVLKAFTSVTSVDVVTTAGAGGGFDKLLESAREVSASESGAESQEKEEQMELPKELAEALDALVAGVKSLTERAEAEDKAKAEALAEAERVAAEAEKPTEVDPLAVVAKLAESKLSAASQARVLEAHKAGKALEEAITAEQAYVKEIAESAPEFKGNGSEEKELSEAATIGSSMYGKRS